MNQDEDKYERRFHIGCLAVILAAALLFAWITGKLFDQRHKGVDEKHQQVTNNF
jgi:hypothetical protein